MYYFQTSQKQPNLGNVISKSLPEDKKNLKLSDFSILENAGTVNTVAGNFYSATYNADENVELKMADGETNSRSSIMKQSKLPVTLLLSSKDHSMGHYKNQFSLSASLNFQDNANCMNSIADSDGKSSYISD